MALRRPETVTIRDASIIFKNFAGEAKKFNQEGDRNFSVMLAELDALELERQGWNVKPMRRQEEDDQQLYHLKVSVSYRVKAPRVWLVSSAGRTLLGEGIISMMDQLEFTRVDLVISAYNWEVNGNSGKKAYLQSMFATLFEDELELEYANVPQLSSVGDAPRELEPGARMAYDFEGDVEE